MALTSSAEIDLAPLRTVGLFLVPAALALSVSPFDPVPPCPLRTLTGIPCPLCGSTRGVIAAVHGDLGRALTLNPASIIVLVLAVLLVATWRVERVRIPVWVVVAGFAALWAYQLFKYSTGRPL
ncbi:MAG: DUF2752 domain-containing protein [Actinomycetota bacterium]